MVLFRYDMALGCVSMYGENYIPGEQESRRSVRESSSLAVYLECSVVLG